MPIRMTGRTAVGDKVDAIVNQFYPIRGQVWSAGADQGRGRYEHYVQSSRYQAWMHQGRWQTDKDVLAFSEDEVIALFQKELGKLLDGGSADVKKAMLEALRLIKERFEAYPPQPAGSRYVRTGTLGRSWRMGLVR